MDEQQQNDTPKREPAWKVFLKSAATFALIDIVWDAMFNSRISESPRRRVAWIAGGGLFGVLFDRFFNKPRQEPSTPMLPPPALPPGQPRPTGMELANIPQILDILVTDGALKPEQKLQVLEQIKQGRAGFAGEIAIAEGFIAQPQLNTALGQQAMLKAAAAAADIQNIKEHGALPAPAFLRANWGNNGVNPAAAVPTRTDGVSAAANIAQNLVMMANANPALAPILFNGVIAAASLANGIALGDSPVTPIGKMHPGWSAVMNDALVVAAHANPQLMTDSNGKPLDVQQFIAARNAEISAAVAETLKNPPQHGAGQGR